MSDDGRQGLTIIAFIGSVFSPYYAHARRRAGRLGADPANHCAINVALYGGRGNRWSMTERGISSLHVESNLLAVGPSALRWDGSGLRIDFDEVTMPVPRRIRGTVRLFPAAVGNTTFTLNADGSHVWRPIAPVARVEVRCDSPALEWDGAGYFDHNRGAGALEDGFRDWTWARAPHGGGAVISYDGVLRDGTSFGLGLLVNQRGEATAFELPPSHDCANTFWRMQRHVRSEAIQRPVVLRSLEDAPFYARSVVSARMAGESVMGVHETLSLDRFRMPIVQAMLPFRMPRRG